MSTQACTTSFDSCLEGDPDLAGEPFERLRFHYGQLLAAEDFSDEQRSIVLRRRLHWALAHGRGTVWGLRVHGRRTDADPRDVLVVRPGLAVDACGREVFVDLEQCLDVQGLHAHALWSKLEPTPGARDADRARRAYVVLAYEACLARPVPAIAEPCADAERSIAWSRLRERFAIDLVAARPEDPHELVRAWLHPSEDRTPPPEPGSLREALLEHLLGEVPVVADERRLEHLWTSCERAPLLLAAVDLERKGDGEGARTEIAGVDNHLRALLPSAQWLGEKLVGRRLQGHDERAPFQVREVIARMEQEGAAPRAVVRVRTTVGVEPASAKPDSFALARFTAGGWEKVAFDVPAPNGRELVLVPTRPKPAEGDLLHVRVIGAGTPALLSADRRPLGGMWSDAAPANGRASDASVVVEVGPLQP